MKMNCKYEECHLTLNRVSLVYASCLVIHRTLQCNKWLKHKKKKKITNVHTAIILTQ